MPEIKKEYPEGQRRTEMMLVRMLGERRSWAEYQDITQALWNIRFHAESMKKERDYLNADTGGNCEATKA
jgi:hypothetical protein